VKVAYQRIDFCPKQSFALLLDYRLVHVPFPKVKRDVHWCGNSIKKGAI
jgi:hypothetical protein